MLQHLKGHFFVLKKLRFAGIYCNNFVINASIFLRALSLFIPKGIKSFKTILNYLENSESIVNILCCQVSRKSQTLRNNTSSAVVMIFLLNDFILVTYFS